MTTTGDATLSVTPDTVQHFHLDPIGGISGDMFLATMLDFMPQLKADVIQSMREAGLPDDWLVETSITKNHSMRGTHVRIQPPASGKSRPTGTFEKIKRMLQDSALPADISAKAIEIFTYLAQAEAHAHGVDIKDVHFHEIADWDSVADIVGAACIITTFKHASWSCATIPLGSGRVKTSHGPLPIPAPATTELLKGLPVMDDGVAGERVTPTGAAILKTLNPQPLELFTKRVIVGSGYGLGSKSFPGIANMLRVVAYAPENAAGLMDERVGVIRFEVDDQSPEDLAVGLSAIREADGVLDVCQWPVYAKKGRLASSVQVICAPGALRPVIETCLLQTTSIGLRWQYVERTILNRSNTNVRVKNTDVRAKHVIRPDGTRSTKLELDDVAAVAGTQREREQLRARADVALEAAGEAS